MTENEWREENLRLLATPEMRLYNRVLNATCEIIQAYRENGFGDPPEEILKMMRLLEAPAETTMQKLFALAEAEVSLEQ